MIYINFKQIMIIVCCINIIMGIVAILYNKRYIVECLGLGAIVIMLFYVLLTHTSARNVNIQAC